MDRTAAIAEAEPQFTHPVRQIVLMLLVVVLVAIGGTLAWAAVEGVFLANIWLNGFIGCVFVFGILACFWQVLQLMQSVRWIEGFARADPGATATAAPRLLAPLAALLRGRGARTQVSNSSARSILESVATRIDEARDITRYLTNLLIFLGLLGTFYGLATTVPAIVQTIRNLAPQPGEDGMQVFQKLMSGLEAQLGGMGTAFSSSLLGLAGSLVVGLLELFASHGQNRFYRELEEWLSSITRLGFTDGEGGADAGGLEAVAEVLDHMSSQMGRMQEIFASAEAGREEADARMVVLSDAVGRLADQTAIGAAQGGELAQSAAAQTGLLTRAVQSGEAVAAILARQEAEGGPDAESRMRLRSMDVQLLRILEEISAGRQESLADIRADLAVMVAALRQLSRAAGGR